MATLIDARELTQGWLLALDALLSASGGEIYDLVVQVNDPSALNHRVVAAVDDFLLRTGRQDTRAVANTIFPLSLAAGSADRDAVYSRYLRMLPRLRRVHGMNRRGTYFGRLIGFPGSNDVNQLELVIDDLRRQRPNAPRRHIYEMQVFVPGRDRWPEGFPCMSSISVHLEQGRVRLAATYRNQYYVERGLGNFVGLRDLQAFIARESDRPVGALSVHAFHAARDGSIRAAREIVAEARRVAGQGGGTNGV
jgi:hypothetical protein